jgi:putative DNA primase/helicase
MAIMNHPEPQKQVPETSTHTEYSTHTAQKSSLAAAHAYHQHGLIITCCCPPDHTGVSAAHLRSCQAPGKAPLHPWKRTTLSPEELTKLWERYPTANVGCVLGARAGVVRLDVDGTGGQALLREQSGGDLPPTWVFTSGSGGWGWLYAYPRDTPCKTTTLHGAGVHQELRLMGDGAQTILPPSRHTDGTVYAWQPGQGPGEIALAPAPAWLIARMQRSAPARQCSPAVYDRVQRALAHLPNTDLPYDTWLQVGMALQSTGAPWARELWDTWSRQSHKFSPEQQEKSWASFRPDGGITLATLFALVKPPRLTHHGMPASDLTNARSLVQRYGKDLHYCYAWKNWLLWTGTHWQRDETGAITERAKHTVEGMYGHLKQVEDRKARDALYAHIKASSSSAKLHAMVDLARSEPGIPITPNVIDQHLWLLNCRNGTLDLRTGILQPHSRADLLTFCLPTAYTPKAPCPTWVTFLWRIMGGSGDWSAPDMTHEDRQIADERATRLIAFLQRAIGYSLTGDTREHSLFLLHGTGRNGKSTFIETLHSLMGPYAKTAEMTTFMAKPTEGVRNDVADLHGARFVSASETEEGKRLSEGLIKRLTGGDMLKARFLFQEHFEFMPQMHVWLSFNRKPLVSGDDIALWERIRLIPFDVFIPPEARDKNLVMKLRAELPGILAWAVQGCLEWQRLGDLAPPIEVVAATESYQHEMDTFGQFLAECCRRAPERKVKMGHLYEAYKEWCEENGIRRPESMMKIGQRLNTMGIERQKGKGVWRFGIGLGEKREKIKDTDILQDEMSDECKNALNTPL